MHISEIAYRLHVIFEQKVMSGYYDSFKGEFGRVQLEAMNYLVEHKGIHGQQLAQALNVPKQHVSKIMSRLEEMGLAVREKDPEDSRASLYSLSVTGLAMMRSHIEESNRLFEQQLSHLSDEDQKKLEKSMQDALEILKKL